MKGKKAPGQGRPKGAQNKFTKTFKGMVEGELERLGPDHFHEWAIENPTDFYRLSARLLPSVRELSGPGGQPIEQRVRTDPKEYTTEELIRILEGAE